jgi:ribosome recycling factor
MSEEVEMAREEAKSSMQKAIEHLEFELSKIRAGRATPAMLEGVMVEYYGVPTPLKQVANVTTPDPRTLTLQAWERNMLEPISTAIINSNLGLNPQNNGEVIIINVPMLTEERRRDLVKKAKAEGEHAKVSIRTARKEANDFIKDAQKDGLPEDEAKRAEDGIQTLTDSYVEKVDKLIALKEEDIMKV